MLLFSLMKKLILILFIILNRSCFINGQFSLDSIPVAEDGNVKYEKAFDISGTKDQRYSKAKIWLSDSFKTSKAVIETDDKEEGILIAKWKMLYNYDIYTVKNKDIEKLNNPRSGNIDFTLKIYLKDNKTKVIVSDIDLPFPGMPAILSNYGVLKIQAARYLLNSDQDNYKSTGMTELSRFEGIHKIITAIMENLHSSLLKK